MKNAPTTVRNESALDRLDSTTKTVAKLVTRLKFRPPAKRILVALMERDFLWREEADRIGGISNTPDDIGYLRKKIGLEIPRDMVKVVTLDGRITRAGQYRLSPEDRVIVQLALDQFHRREKAVSPRFAAEDLV